MDEMPIANDLAMEWLRRHVGHWERTNNPRALDVGCRWSDWPQQLVQLGYDVTAVDRDEQVMEWQGKLMTAGLMWNVDVADARALPFLDGHFGLVTGVFALQHTFSENDEEDIVAYRECARVVCPGGTMLLVQAHAPESFFWYDRADPMRVNSTEDVFRRIIEPTGLIPIAIDSFRYNYEANTGDWCSLEESNAICLALRAPV